MKNRNIRINNLVYSSFGAGVVIKCHNNFFGDSETVYEVNYFERGIKMNRLKDFKEIF